MKGTWWTGLEKRGWKIRLIFAFSLERVQTDMSVSEPGPHPYAPPAMSEPGLHPYAPPAAPLRPPLKQCCDLGDQQSHHFFMASTSCTVQGRLQVLLHSSRHDEW